jgi:hypothetical protein
LTNIHLAAYPLTEKNKVAISFKFEFYSYGNWAKFQVQIMPMRDNKNPSDGRRLIAVRWCGRENFLGLEQGPENTDTGGLGDSAHSRADQTIGHQYAGTLDCRSKSFGSFRR